MFQTSTDLKLIYGKELIELFVRIFLNLGIFTYFLQRSFGMECKIETKYYRPTSSLIQLCTPR